MTLNELMQACIHAKKAGVHPDAPVYVMYDRAREELQSTTVTTVFVRNNYMPVSQLCLVLDYDR